MSVASKAKIMTTTYEQLFPPDCDQHCTSMKDEISTQEQTFSSNLVCSVCGAPATGYNFDQITCESCKIFFRRNAFRDLFDLKCRYISTCVIDVRTRRRCAHCRLKKCFDVNMRKEWIRTEEEIELRRLQKLANEQRRLNRQAQLDFPLLIRRKKRLRIKSISQDPIVNNPMSVETLFSFHRNFSDEDRIILNNITNAYQCIDEQAESLRRREWKPVSSIVQFLNRENETHRSLINFYKLIPDFNRLDIDDRVLLIKSNAIKMVPLHCALIYRFHEHPKIGKYMSKWIGADFHQRMSHVFRRCDRFIEYSLVLKLTLIIFIFTIHLSAPYAGDYSNRKIIREIQEFYATLLWRYLKHIYDENEAIQSMSMITVQILNFQTLVNEIEKVACQEPDCNTFNELELSLLRLTL